MRRRKPATRRVEYSRFGESERLYACRGAAQSRIDRRAKIAPTGSRTATHEYTAVRIEMGRRGRFMIMIMVDHDVPPCPISSPQGRTGARPSYREAAVRSIDSAVPAAVPGVVLARSGTGTTRPLSGGVSPDDRRCAYPIEPRRKAGKIHRSPQAPQRN